MARTVSITTFDGSGSFPAYVVEPAQSPKGAVIVVQEVFGVNPGIRKKAEHWAALGYLAVAPEVFWRQGLGIDLDADIPEQFQQAITHMMAHDFDLGIQDIEATIHWIRREAAVPKVGLVGYCMGGKVAYQAATRTDIDASVGYYGVGIDQMLGESRAIARPLMLHIPTADHFVGAEAQAAIHAGLDGNTHVTIHDYDGLDHGFAAEDGVRRDAAAAGLADGRTEAFFAANLG